MKELSPKGLGLAAGILSAAGMLIKGVLALFGVYMEAFEAMKAFYIGFDATILGVVVGIVESFVFSYIVGYLFALLYNKLA